MDQPQLEVFLRLEIDHLGVAVQGDQANCYAVGFTPLKGRRKWEETVFEGEAGLLPGTVALWATPVCALSRDRASRFAQRNGYSCELSACFLQPSPETAVVFGPVPALDHVVLDTLVQLHGSGSGGDGNRWHALLKRITFANQLR